MAVIVIDPGHGGTGKVGGSSGNNATSPSGMLEKDLTLAVARHAEQALAARGHTVRLTRTADVNLSLVDRAAVAKSARADAFVSIHFNGFGDTTVQGTETWVHQNGSAQSVELAGCVQRAVLQATRHRDRGVRRKVLGVVDPANHAQGTAACLAELSFITTSAEDVRLHDPEYLKALGDAVANGVQEFVGQQDVRLEAAAAPRVERTIATAGRAAAFRTPVAFSASTTVSPTARPSRRCGRRWRTCGRPSTRCRRRGARRSSPARWPPGGEPGQSHIQGLAGYKDVFLLTHSDADEESGRILVLDRVREHKFVKEFRLPTFSTSGPSFFHAGGCQLIGDVLAVPSESGKNASVIAFFDVSDPMHIKEFNGALRIARDSRDAAAVGITTVTRNGQTVWLLAVYDSGTVDFYESPDFPGGALFEPRFTCRVEEKDHQHLLLFTDQANRVFAVGLNRGNFFFFDKLVVYAVDLAGHTMTPDPDRDISTGRRNATCVGVRRWRSVGDQLALHCTERDYGDSCTINTFHAAAGQARDAHAAGRAARTRRSTKAATAKKAGKTRKSKRSPR